jgi:hypothetical protein
LAVTLTVQEFLGANSYELIAAKVPRTLLKRGDWDNVFTREIARRPDTPKMRPQSM